MLIAPKDYHNGFFTGEGFDKFDLSEVLKQDGNVMLLDGIGEGDINFTNLETGVNVQFNHDFGNTMIFLTICMNLVINLKEK